MIHNLINTKVKQTVFTIRRMELLESGLTENVIYTIDGIPCEIEYLDKNGKVVIYWAYGTFY